MTSGSPVESVRRAFALLEELNRQRINSVQHLHEATALPKSTIVRLLETLRLLGYVANDPRQGGYQVTSGVRTLSSGFHGDPLVVEAARSWAIEFTRRQAFHFVEHQVFEQMCEPGLALAFVARADFEPHVVRDYGRSVVFDQEHVQTVRHREALDPKGRAERDALAMGDLAVRRRIRVELV